MTVLESLNSFTETCKMWEESLVRRGHNMYVATDQWGLSFDDNFLVQLLLPACNWPNGNCWAVVSREQRAVQCWVQHLNPSLALTQV